MDDFCVINIFGVKISIVTNRSLLKKISDFLNQREQKIITYVTANSLNIAYDNYEVKRLFNKFDVVHCDGIGVYFASKFLFGNNAMTERMTGSDFYHLLIETSIINSWKLFFFGDETATLEKIHLNNPSLTVVGMQNGFNYTSDNVVKKINNSKADILFVGLGCPRQEHWIIKNKENLNVRVILAVGDGTKVFAGTKKRGNILIRKLGLEWFIRLIFNPKIFWKRYVIGIPLFLHRVIIYKLKMGKA
jgi:N-acetylglucosaminyldiphosphoundecaprenol N-acetyl-beta-D-mannosaminyltransferase